MKLFGKCSLIAVACFFFQSVSAQYSVNRYTIAPGKNPGGIKNDYEYSYNVFSGPDPGWMGFTFPFVPGGSNNSWSLPAQLPISFNFNGSPVTYFKLHRTGVITFDTAATVIPTHPNSTIPSSSIPAKSIMVWGFDGWSSSTNPQYRLYGSAPDRQLWVYFKDASFSSSYNPYFWSIVLEEGTDKIYIVNQFGRVYSTSLPLTVGVQVDALTAYAVSSTAALPCTPRMQVSPDDNVYYEFSFSQPLANDVSVSSVSYPDYNLLNSADNVKFSFINRGTSTVTDVALKYSYLGNIYTDSKTGLSVPPGETVELIHSIPLSLTQTSKQPLVAWCEYAGDNNSSNDSALLMVSGLSFTPVKKVLYECAQGTWCTWNDLGFQYTDSIYSKFSAITELINVQETPAITDADYVNGIFNLHWAVPDGYVDRKYVGTLYTENYTVIPLRYDEPTPCDITTQALFDPVSRNLSINLSSHFAASLMGDYRFNAVIVEEDVDQDLITHDRSAHVALAGFEGQANSLPFVINDGETHLYSFNYILPSSWDISKIRVIGWVCDQTTSLILNTAGTDVITDVETLASYGFDAHIMGNPVTISSSLKITLEKDAAVSLKIIDINGKIINDVASRDLSSGSYYYLIGDQVKSSGIYIVQINVNGIIVTRKFVVE
ncbi:MAG: T9SS type A sorting domain-containing protein [Bacteroidota bacterium]